MWRLWKYHVELHNIPARDLAIVVDGDVHTERQVDAVTKEGINILRLKRRVGQAEAEGKVEADVRVPVARAQSLAVIHIQFQTGSMVLAADLQSHVRPRT